MGVSGKSGSFASFHSGFFCSPKSTLGVLFFYFPLFRSSSLSNVDAVPFPGFALLHYSLRSFAQILHVLQDLVAKGANCGNLHQHSKKTCASCISYANKSFVSKTIK